MVSMLYGGLDTFNLKYSELFTNSYMPTVNCSRVSMVNIAKSSEVLDYEDVDEIRNNAPAYFRMGQRLVTKDDFRTFILTEFKNRVTDVYVCNNNEYMASFYRWLDKYGKLDVSIRLDYYVFADAVDFNNIYLWLKPARQKLLSSDKKIIVNKCNEIKSLTTNLVPLDGVKVSFFPFCMSNASSMPDADKANLAASLLSNTANSQTTILVKKRKTYLSDETIRQNIAQIILDYFNAHSKLGDMISLSDLALKITSLEYVDTIKTSTRHQKTDGSFENEWQNGLCFCSFTKSLVECKDFEVNGQYVALENFQYASLPLDKTALYNIVRIENDGSFSLRNDEF